MLARWRRGAEIRSAAPFTGSGTARDQEFAQSHGELAKVRKECDFLRDTAAYFAKGSSSGTK